MRASYLLLLCAVLLLDTQARSQRETVQAIGAHPNLFSLHGTHADSGSEYLRLLLTAEPGSTVAPSIPDPRVSPTFTLECTQLKTRRTVSLYANFGGIADLSFPVPFRPTQDNPFPPRNATVPLTMVFEGYIKSKPFKRDWEALPNGNYRYRNPGMGSSNLDDPRFFLQYLNSLPTLHVTIARPDPGKPGELFFHTTALLQEASRSPLCQP